MIHYILLPAEERHALRREYRVRLAITAFFYVSLAVMIGIVSLIPSFLYSSSQEKDALARDAAVQQSRQNSGADAAEKELVATQAIAARITKELPSREYNAVIQRILLDKKSDLLLTNFQIERSSATSTVGDMTVEGIAGTRESLLDFKKRLEADSTFTAIDLPLSDLAKNKNIFFTLRLKIKKS